MKRVAPTLLPAALVTPGGYLVLAGSVAAAVASEPNGELRPGADEPGPAEPGADDQQPVVKRKPPAPGV